MMNGSSSTASRPSTIALRRLFQWIESRYGGIPMEQGSAADVIQSSDATLQECDLVRLLCHEALALHVPGFYQSEAAQQLGQRLAREAETSAAARNWKVSTNRGLESSDVVTLGQYAPFNVASAGNNPVAIQEYFRGVQREHFHRRIDPLHPPRPFLWPLDLLRLQLDEAWPSGAGLARYEDGRAFGSGLPRIMIGPTRWKKGYIHVDEMGPLHVASGLFSANIYLQLPNLSEETDAAGIPDHPPSSSSSSSSSDHTHPPPPQGLLEIWPTRIRSRWDWYRNGLLLSGLSSQDATAQVRLRQELGAPTVVRVSPGDLVLFCVQRPHAAMGFAEGTRVSLQCFIQHSGPRQRLLIDA
jgi:hypothetical protein